MTSELLSVCIPTRNRAAYLRDLLTSFARQVKDAGLNASDVAFYISDNAAEDATPEVIREFAAQVTWAVCNRNPVNIGGDENILHVRKLAQGKYVWVIGDDELLADEALVKLVRLIRERAPGLVLAYPTRYELHLRTPQTFADYKAFARECVCTNVHALAEHSLISCNIYRADCYDFDLARKSLQTHYSQLYGMIPPLLNNRAAVVLPDFPIIIMRDTPASAVDGFWVADLDAVWINYFKWLREELALPELNPHGPSHYARRALRVRILRHPLRFMANNWRSFFSPAAYFFVFNRLFRRRN